MRGHRHAQRLRRPGRNLVAEAIVRSRTQRYMTTLSISALMLEDGEESATVLGELGWLLGLGAEVAARQPGDEALQLLKALHAGLCTVIAMCERGNRWEIDKALELQQVAEKAEALLYANAALSLELAPDADWLGERIRTGVATLADVAGAEIYATGANA